MTNEEIKNITLESLRDWFKKEKWVRISSSGNIAGPCGTSKNKKNPDRCLPKAKAQSLTKGQRAATAAKKKKAGAKGKTVVKNTKKATVKKENLQIENVDAVVGKVFGTVEKAGQKLLDIVRRETKQTIYALKEIAEMVIKREKPTPAEQNKIVEQLKDFAYLGALVVKDKFLIFAVLYYIIDKSDIADELLKLNETSDPQDGKAAPYGSGFKPTKMTRKQIEELVWEVITEKDDRCTRIAKRKYDTWPSAYASGAVVRCRRGEIWKGVK